MTKWTEWKNLPGDLDSKQIKKEEHEEFDGFGIYQIRMVNPDLASITIPRLIGEEPEGIIYIGRSGLLEGKTRRTIITRMKEFCSGNHSGSWTYHKMLEHTSNLPKHILQVRAYLLDRGIDIKEHEELKGYFKKHGELPPCNSSFPLINRW